MTGRRSFLRSSQADDVYLGIVDSALPVFANVESTEALTAFGKHLVIQIDAGVQLHPGRSDDVRDVLGKRNRAANR